MTEPDKSSASISRLQSAAQPFGDPGVITQYTEKGSVSRRVTVRRLGQFALNESVFFILEGEKIQGFVYLAEISALRIETGRTYKHPIVGAIIGLAMMIVPVAVIAEDPANAGKSFGGDFFVVWAPVMAIVGLYTFYEAVLSKKVPWLIVKTKTKERPFMLYEPLTESQSALISALDSVLPDGDDPLCPT